MEPQEPHIIPSIYLSGYLTEFKDLFLEYGAIKHTFNKGDFLTQRGVINNTAWYVDEGVIQLSLGHDQGRKALNLFGPGTVFPIGVEEHKYLIEYEMVIEAFSQVKAYALSYPSLKRLVTEHGDFAGELLRENCDFIGYMFFDTINQTFEPCLARICDILYLYLIKVHPCHKDIPMTQAELARVAGASRQQLERSNGVLKQEGIISTARGSIYVIDEQALLEHCTLSLRSSVL